jgi:hypothetical protein
MRPVFRVLVLLSASLAIPIGLSAQKKPQSQRPFRIFVTVIDRTGAPVLDLSPDEFDVTEGGSKVRVVRASLVKEPMRIALLVDTSDESQGSLIHIRGGLRAFLDAIPPQDEILLMSTGGQARVRVATTLDRRKLTNAADGLFADGGAAVLLDALLESWTRFLRDAEDRWPVFVMVGTNGPDGSHTTDFQFEAFIRDIRGSAASAHAIMLSSSQSYSKGFAASLDVTEYTGGHYEALAASSALPARMKRLGEQIAAQQKEMSRRYEVDFISQSRDPLVRTLVTVARDGTRVELTAGRPIQ